MRFEVVPIQCRLSKASLDQIVQYANIGTKSLPASFKLQQRHELQERLSIEELFEYLADEFAPYTIAVVSRNLAPKNDHCTILGLADVDSRIGLARTDPSYRRRLRNEGLAQTIIHEGIHLIGQDHHNQKVYTEHQLLCPFYHYQEPEKMDLVPCAECQTSLIEYHESRYAA